jgi:DNA-binding MarR family transcriptional regulator
MGAHAIDGVTASRDVLDSLRRIVQVLRESSRRAEQELGITGAQLFVLEQLVGVPSQSLNELAERTRTHQSSVSTVVGRLVERGLVVRQRSLRDARRLELALTARGRRMTANTPGVVQNRLIRTIDDLPPRSRRQLASLLRQVVGGLDAQERRPQMFFNDDRKRTARRHA